MGRRTKAEPKTLVIPPGATIGDVDLDEEVVMFEGERLTEARAEQIAEETMQRYWSGQLTPGRKSLSGGNTHSPRVQFRVPESLAAKAQQRAAAEGKSISALAREALERYLAS